MSLLLKHQGHSILADVLEWDIKNWSRAIEHWSRANCPLAGATVLDIGSRRGGLSLLFAINGARVICSDLDGPASEAQGLHSRYGVGTNVTYRALNATSLDMPNMSVDVVCFKSILGGIGRDDNFAAQEKTMAEIWRVLKPGGWLFFAENLSASSLHQFLRRRFVSWGAAWRYVHHHELPILLKNFDDVEYDTWGFTAAFGRTEKQRQLLATLDLFLSPITAKSARYIAFGHARKPRD